MIKNSNPEIEAFLAAGYGPVTERLAQQLEAFGVSFEEAGGQFHLSEILDLLEPRAVLRYSGNCIDPGGLEIYRQVGSTNDVVIERLAGQSPIVCLAEMQLAGKGRRGRRWVSPFGRNIYMTVGLAMQCEMAKLEGLSLVVGMCVTEVMREMGLRDVGLKWPNDLLLVGGKLGGILVELTSLPKSTVGVVIGIGINLGLRAEQAEEIEQAWSEVGKRLDISRNRLAGKLIQRLFELLPRFESGGFAVFAEDWPRYSVYTNKAVRIIRGDQVFEGIDRGVDEAGNLLLETGSGIQSHNAGEVSLRPVVPA